MAGTPVYTILTQDQRKLYSDLSLSNEYVVEFGLPPDLIQFLGREGYMESGVTLDPRAYGVLCSDVSLPGSTFATSEVKDNFLGVTQEFAHTRLYTDIDATFYVDKKYRVLELFQGWMDFISGGSGGKVAQNLENKGFYRRFRFPDEYKTSVQIAKMEKDYGIVGKDFKSRTYSLVNAFPKSISSVPVSYGPADILKITVTFNYDRYIIIRENQTGSSSSGTTQASQDQSPQEPESAEQRQARLRRERTLVIQSGQSPLSPGAPISPRERSLNR